MIPLVLAAKDLRQLVRNKPGLFWIVVFPVVMAMVFGAVFSGSQSGASRALRIAVVDEDGSEASRALVERIRKSESLEVRLAAGPEARELVRRGRLTAFVGIPAGFGAGSRPFSPHPAELELGIDPSRKAEAGILHGLLMQAAYEGVGDQLADPERARPMVAQSLSDIEKAGADLPPDQKERLRRFLTSLDGYLAGSPGGESPARGVRLEPVRIRTVGVAGESARPRSAYEISFPQAIVWALIACSTSFALALVRERMTGTFLRLRAAPISQGQILAGKGMACFAVCLLVTGMILVLGRVAGGVRWSQPGLLALAVACSAACFVGIMVFISVMGRTDQAVSGAGWGILMIFSMLGGGMVPLIFLPGWMLTVGNASPVKWAILALEGAIWRGFTPAEMLGPCGALLGFGAAFLAGGWTLFRRMEGQ